MDKLHSKYLKNQKTTELLNLIEREKPQKADVIVWLQGDRYDRGKKVLSLFKNKWAAKIIISGNNYLIGSQKRKGENNISLNEMVEWLKNRGVESKNIIIDNNSFNTKDQAKNILKITKDKKWKKIILVASLYHQLRVFLTFLKRSKVIGWNGVLVNQPAKMNWETIPSGRKKKCRELLIEEINKIRHYPTDVATIKEAIFYLKRENYDKRDKNCR